MESFWYYCHYCNWFGVSGIYARHGNEENEIWDVGCGEFSAAISAACHTHKKRVMDGQAMVMKRLKWGVMKTYEGGMIDHCGLSDEEVEFPMDGVEYR